MTVNLVTRDEMVYCTNSVVMSYHSDSLHDDPLQSSVAVYMTLCLFQFSLSSQDGDSAVIRATAEYQPAVLRELVRGRSNLNLQNQVRYTITVNTASHIIPCCPY